MPSSPFAPLLTLCTRAARSPLLPLCRRTPPTGWRWRGGPWRRGRARGSLCGAASAACPSRQVSSAPLVPPAAAPPVPAGRQFDTVRTHEQTVLSSGPDLPLLLLLYSPIDLDSSGWLQAAPPGTQAATPRRRRPQRRQPAAHGWRSWNGGSRSCSKPCLPACRAASLAAGLPMRRRPRRWRRRPRRWLRCRRQSSRRRRRQRRQARGSSSRRCLWRTCSGG